MRKRLPPDWAFTTASCGATVCVNELHLAYSSLADWYTVRFSKLAVLRRLSEGGTGVCAGAIKLNRESSSHI